MELNKGVFQGLTLAKDSPCDAELQELMHQIDIMVNSKKMEWERKMRALEAKMDIRDQELANAQSKLDQKGQEVGLLQQKLENLQKAKSEMVQNYEVQLEALKSQFLKLIHSYEKLQLHQLKQKKGQSGEKRVEGLEMPFELSTVTKKMEEFEAKSREWDKKGTIYQNHLVYLDAQQKLLSEKCNLFQKQTQNYQFQISSKKTNQDDVITSLQPRSEKDELIIEKLKATVNEIAINRNKLEEENLRLQEDLKMYQKQCQNMEAGFSEMKNELQSRDALWRGIQLECQQLHTELLKIRQQKDMQEIQIKHQSSCVQLTEQLENKNGETLAFAESQESQQEKQKKIRDHLYKEKQSHCSEQERIRTEISDLTEELHQKEITIATIMEKASLLERQLKMELEIKDKLLAKQQLLDFRYKAVKCENTHLKDMMENQECKRYMNIDLSNQKHGSYTAPLYKLGQENVRLRNSLIKLRNNTEASRLDAVDTCKETEHSYQAHSKMQEKKDRFCKREYISTAKQEQDNEECTSQHERFKGKKVFVVVENRNDWAVEDAEDFLPSDETFIIINHKYRMDFKIERIFFRAQKSRVYLFNEEQEGKEKILPKKRTFQNEDEWQMRPQQTTMFTADRYHRNCSPTLYGQGDIIGPKCGSTSHKLDRGHEQELDGKSSSPPTGFTLCSDGLPPEEGRTGILLGCTYSTEDISLPSPPDMSLLATTEKFLQEEEKHTKEFEDRLNSHIEELQRHSENTLRKYARLKQNRHI